MTGRLGSLGPAARALVVALIGACAGAAFMAGLFATQSAFTLEMDRELPRFAAGFHDVELAQDVSFAWTKRRAAVTLAGLDRRTPWVCTVRVRGARAAPLPQPLVSLGVDGVTVDSRPATNTYQTLDVRVPAATGAGVVIDITSDPPFVPGPADTRELGVQVDRLTCRSEGWPLPPSAALRTATIGGAAFGAAFALLGSALGVSVGATLLLALAQAIPLTASPAPYSVYQHVASMSAVWIALVMILTASTLGRVRRQPLDAAARSVIALSGAALFLLLLGLLHPAKALIDAVFHAHRLQWVLDGRYYFTQPMPDGVRFPYAIGLYVFAVPWTWATRDFVTLLRVVVLAWHALAGLLLFVMVMRTWGDRVAGVLAVVLFYLVPLPFIVIGNANLTYAFGQSAAFVTLAAAIALTSDDRVSAVRRLSQFAGLFLLAALAMLSHVGVFPVLLTLLILMAGCYWLFGGPALRRPARQILFAAVLAAVFSVVSYYGQFREVYGTLSRVTSGGAATAPAPKAGETAAKPPAVSPGLTGRLTNAAFLGSRALGWPIVLLATVGAVLVARDNFRDGLTLALVAGLATYMVFVAGSIAAPVEPRFQRYTDEFIDRLNYATMPVAVLLGARAASAGLKHGWVIRITASVVLAAAAVYGVRAWLAWFR